MSFSSIPPPQPLDWITNPDVIRELNQLYHSMRSNNFQDNPNIEDWECRVAQAMYKQKPCLDPESWLGCHDIVIQLNNLWNSLHGSEETPTDWECHLADHMYMWTGMENFFHLNEPKTPPQTPKKKKRPSPPPAPKKRRSKRRRTNTKE